MKCPACAVEFHWSGEEVCDSCLGKTDRPVIGERYAHRASGGVYRVVALGHYEPRGREEPVVVYQDTRSPYDVWVRPLRGESGWLTQVGGEKRFKHVARTGG